MLEKMNKFIAKISVLPLSIVYVIAFCVINSLYKIAFSLLSLFHIENDYLLSEISNINFVSYMILLMALIYLLIARWIIKGYEEGRLSLLLLTLLDIALMIWPIIKLSAFLLVQNGKVASIIWQDFFTVSCVLICSIITVVMLRRKKVKNYCNKYMS